MIEPTQPSRDTSEIGVLARTAAVDMGVIFGTGVRSYVPATATVLESSARRPLLVATAGVLLIGSVITGLLVGNLAAVTVPPAVETSTRLALRHKSAPAAPAPAAPVQAQMFDATAPEPVPAERSASITNDAREVIAGARAANSNRRIAVSPTVPTAASHPPTETFSQPLAPAPACEDDDACVAAGVDTAEQRLETAYRRAVTVGVRARTLRGYEHEWDRARGLAEDRPMEAIRLFAMMTSDLRNLAEDQAARDDADPR